jgi:hypothetical protein
MVAGMLALRVLASTGLMPAVEHGRVTVIACPDADDSSPFAIGSGHHHHDGQNRHPHPLCPYASASSLSFLKRDFAPLLSLLMIVGSMLLIAQVRMAVVPDCRYLRPPLRGPPLSA